MKIVRDIKADGNLNTSLYDLLENIKDDNQIFHNNEHRLRHPLAIYNIGSKEFLDSYKKLLDYIHHAQSDPELITNKNTNIYDLLKDTIGNFASFIDDTYAIFKCFFGIEESSYKGKYNDKWFQNAAPESFNRYRKDLEIASMIVSINNEVKHNNGRFATLYISSKFHGRTFGFYLESVDDTGCIIPNEKIHTKFKGMRTAVSYTWFIHEIIADFYFICDSAAKIIKDILIKKGYKLPVNIIYSSSEENEYIFNIFGLVQTVRTKLLFPDECETRKVSQVTLTDGILTIQNPATMSFMKKLMNESNYIITMVTSGDGMTRSFGMVYH